MDRKIIVLGGISGSGKSTFAKEMFESNPKLYTIINRDKIRELLFGYTESNIKDYYLRKDIYSLEKEVTKYEDVLINESISSGKIPIVDATHLKKAYLKRFEYWNVPIEYKYFTISVKEAITRISSRSRKIDVEVIQKQYDSYLNLQREGLPVHYTPIVLNQDENLPSCVIFDVDGTLAHKGSRNAYDWKLVGNDTVDLPVSALYHNIEDKFVTIVCTGRDGVCKEETLKWFDDNYLPKPAEFYIREENDMRPDWVIKEEMWRDISARYNIVFIVDDRNQVVRRARSLGLKVLQVEYNNF